MATLDDYFTFESCISTVTLPASWVIHPDKIPQTLGDARSMNHLKPAAGRNPEGVLRHFGACQVRLQAYTTKGGFTLIRPEFLTGRDGNPGFAFVTLTDDLEGVAYDVAQRSAKDASKPMTLFEKPSTPSYLTSHGGYRHMFTDLRVEHVRRLGDLDMSAFDRTVDFGHGVSGYFRVDHGINSQGDIVDLRLAYWIAPEKELDTKVDSRRPDGKVVARKYYGGMMRFDSTYFSLNPIDFSQDEPIRGVNQQASFLELAYLMQHSQPQRFLGRFADATYVVKN